MEGAAQDSAESTRREFIKKAAYMAPAILTLRVAPAFAKPGSVKSGTDDQSNTAGHAADRLGAAGMAGGGAAQMDVDAGHSTGGRGRSNGGGDTATSQNGAGSGATGASGAADEAPGNRIEPASGPTGSGPGRPREHLLEGLLSGLLK